MNLKPILEIREGKIELVTSVMTRKKSIATLLQLVEAGIAGRTPVRISVFHALAIDAAEELLETARKRFKPVECILSAHDGRPSLHRSLQDPARRERTRSAAVRKAGAAGRGTATTSSSRAGCR